MKRSLIAITLTLITSVCYGANDKERLAYAMQYACDSYLKELNFHSPYAEFESCTLRDSRDVIPNPLVLKYRVKGEFAAQIEQQLYETYKVPMFVKQESVALWETGGYYDFTDSKYVIDISFVSQETLVQERKDWHKIPYFTIWFEKRPDF